jgi:hypothetical protein
MTTDADKTAQAVERMKASLAILDAESNLVLAERRVAREERRARAAGLSAKAIADARRLARNAAADERKGKP